MQKKDYFASIIVWFGGLVLLFAIDYIIRLASVNYYTLGMNETVWFLLQIMIAIGSFALLVKAVKQMPMHKAVLLSGVTIVVGLIVYLALTWLYVVGTGIDSV